jgi:hypothetical protein
MPELDNPDLRHFIVYQHEMAIIPILNLNTFQYTSFRTEHLTPYADRLLGVKKGETNESVLNYHIRLNQCPPGPVRECIQAIPLPIKWKGLAMDAAEYYQKLETTVPENPVDRYVFDHYYALPTTHPGILVHDTSLKLAQQIAHDHVLKTYTSATGKSMPWEEDVDEIDPYYGQFIYTSKRRQKMIHMLVPDTVFDLF